MTKQNEQRQTAKIYAFPAQRRTNPDSQVRAAEALPMIEFGRGWYHQAAIEEANEARDHRRRQH